MSEKEREVVKVWTDLHYSVEKFAKVCTVQFKRLPKFGQLNLGISIAQKVVKRIRSG